MNVNTDTSSTDCIAFAQEKEIKSEDIFEKISTLIPSLLFNFTEAMQI